MNSTVEEWVPSIEQLGALSILVCAKQVNRELKNCQLRLTGLIQFCYCGSLTSPYIRGVLSNQGHTDSPPRWLYMASSLRDKLVPSVLLNSTLRFTLLRIVCISQILLIIEFLLLPKSTNYYYIEFLVVYAVIFVHHFAR